MKGYLGPDREQFMGYIEPFPPASEETRPLKRKTENQLSRQYTLFSNGSQGKTFSIHHLPKQVGKNDLHF